MKPFAWLADRLLQALYPLTIARSAQAFQWDEWLAEAEQDRENWEPDELWAAKQRHPAGHTPRADGISAALTSPKGVARPGGDASYVAAGPPLLHLVKERPVLDVVGELKDHVFGSAVVTPNANREFRMWATSENLVEAKIGLIHLNMSLDNWKKLVSAVNAIESGLFAKKLNIGGRGAE